MMQAVVAIFARWIAILAALVNSWQMHAQSRKSILVSQEAGRFSLRRTGAAQGDILANVALGTQAPAEIAQSLRDRFIIFELGLDKIVTRRLNVPLQAQDFLAGIVRNQIERLSPWPPAQAVYAIDAKPSPDDPGVLNVSVFIASQASIAGICDELTAAGLAPHRIDLRKEADIAAPALTLWTRPSDQPRHSRQNLPRMIGIGLAAVGMLSLAVSLWAVYSANAIEGEREDVAARIKTLQRHAQGSKKTEDLALLAPSERAWALKENAPAAVLILEALSRALPETAYLTELHLEKTTLRIIGLASDAPSLIGALEKSGHFSQVHFFAPTTKGQSGELYKFFIETKLDERPGLIGE
jgi:general secretion pathway protein L